MSFVAYMRRHFDRDPPTNAMLWHKWYVFFPVRVEGGIAWHEVWRKWTPSGWAYQQRETEEEWTDRYL